MVIIISHTTLLFLKCLSPSVIVDVSTMYVVTMCPILCGDNVHNVHCDNAPGDNVYNVHIDNMHIVLPGDNVQNVCGY